MPASVEDLVTTFKTHVINKAQNESFIHHKWFVKYHLEIAEQVALELLEFYPQADRTIVRVLIWLHDYGKIIDRSREHELTAPEGKRILTEIGFAPDFIDRVIDYAITLDSHSKMDLTTAPIEVQIVSSADGCSHFIGPFYALWFWENPDRPFEELMEDKQRKIATDWTRKIVLPEAKAAFAGRYQHDLGQAGVFPERFIPSPAHS